MNEIVLENDRLISTSKASELTGYSRDYLGQLCRVGTVICKRIGNQWFIDADSLKEYAPKMRKPKKSDFYKPDPKEQVPKIEDVGTGSFVLGEDEYIPTQKAAQLYGYTQDYVGQLARSGEVPAKKIGRRWFVSKNALKEHKKQKDALLQAVQTESVSIKREQEDKLKSVDFSIKYLADDGTPLIPENRIHHSSLDEAMQTAKQSRFSAIKSYKNIEKSNLGKPSYTFTPRNDSPDTDPLNRFKVSSQSSHGPDSTLDNAELSNIEGFETQHDFVELEEKLISQSSGFGDKLLFLFFFSFFVASSALFVYVLLVKIGVLNSGYILQILISYLERFF